MKYHSKCRYCKREFTHVSQGLANACLVNHTKGAHPQHYNPSKYALARTNPKQESVFAIGVNPADKPASNEPAAPVRAYKRKEKTIGAVSYCPKCGCNIRAVQVAMGL